MRQLVPTDLSVVEIPMDDNKSSSSCTTNEWIEEALYEYEQIANLCNEQSYLGNASLSILPSSPSSPHGPETVIDDSTSSSSLFDPKILENKMKYNQLVDHLSSYSSSIDSVRNTHLRLKSKLMSLSNHDNKAIIASATTKQDKESTSSTPGRGRRRASSAMEDAFFNHIELSERVIRTIMKSSKHDCGILFQNGMIRSSSSSSNDHEINIVALAALRASISQLKANFGSKDKS